MDAVQLYSKALHQNLGKCDFYILPLTRSSNMLEEKNISQKFNDILWEKLNLDTWDSITTVIQISFSY